MSRVIDERVAALRFDNAQFERNVGTSLSTLDKLKRALDFTGHTKSFQDIEAAAAKVTFSRMADSLDELRYRFSTLGIVGMTVIQDLTRTVERFVTGTLSSLIGKIYEGGKARAFNIENAHFLLQGLYDDAEKIKAIEDDAMQSVTDTAYGYDEAIKTAASLAASGVSAGKEMQSVLAGIAGVAATTSSEYSAIADVFRDAAGRGRAMGYELSRLSGYGINAAKVLSDYFNAINDGSKQADESITAAVKSITGGAKVTEAEIMDMASKSKISFEVFAQAISDTFGKHAKEANKTVVGTLSNINARFSQIGAKFFSPLIAQEGPLVTFLNKVMNKFGELRDKIDPIAKLFTDTVIRILDIGGRLVDAIPVAAVFDKINKYVGPLSKKLDSVFGTIEKYAKPVSTITEENIKGLGLSEKALSHFQNVLKDVAKEHNIDLDSMLKSENSFWDSLKNGWLTSDIFKEALDKITGGAKDATEEFDKLKEAAVAVIRGDYGNDPERTDLLTAAGFDPEKVQAYVNKIHELTGGTWNLNDAVLEAAAAEVGLSSNLENVSDKELEALGYTEEDIKALRELGEEADKTATPFGRFSASIEKVRKKLSELYNKAKEIAENIFKNVKAIGGSIEDAFSDALGDLFSSLPDFDTIKAGAKNGLGFISSFLSSFTIDESRLDQIKRIFRGIFSIVHIVLEFASRIFGGVLPAFFEDGKNGAESLIETLATIGDKIYEFSQKFEISDDTLNKIIRTLKGVLAAASIVFGFLSFFVRTAFGPFVGVLSYVFEFVLDKAALLGDILVEIDKKIKETDLFKNTLDKVTGIFDKVKSPKKLTEFFKSIKSVSDISKKVDAKNIKSMLETVVGAVSDAVSDFLSIEVVAVIAIFFLIYKAIKGIIGLFGKVTNGPGALIDIVSNLGKAFKSMGGMFENIGKAAKKFGIASMIFSIAFAFGQIAKAVYLLSEMDDAKIKQAIVMTVLIGGIIIGIYAAIAAMDAKANIRPSLEAIGFIIVAAFAFKRVADALLEIKDLSWQQIGVGIIGLVGALGLMGLVAVMLSKLETKLSLSALAFPILYAKGLKDIAKALATLKDVGWKQLLNAFGALMASLAIMAVIAQKLSELKTKIDLSALAFPILYAKGLKDIAKAFATLKDLSDWQVLRSFLALMATLSIMAVIAQKLSELKTKIDLSALAFPILYAKGLKDIAKAFNTLKDIGDGQLLRAFGALMASLVVMTAIAEYLSNKKSELSLSALAFPILYAKGLKDIAKAFATLKDIDEGELLRAFGALMASLVVMTAIAEYLSNKKSELSLSALAFPILYAKGLKDIAKAFATLKDMGWKQLLNAFGALMASLVVMTAIAEYLSNKKSELSLSALAFPILYAKGLKDIAKAFATLKDIDEGELLRAFGALMASLVIMTIIAEFLSSEKSKLDASVLAFPIAFGAGLLLIALAIRAVGTMASEDLAQGLNAMLGVMVVLGAIIGVMSGFTTPLKQIADVFLEFAFSSVLISAGFAIIAVSFIALAMAIKMFEGVSIEQVVIGLIALAGAMTILVVAANFLTVTGVGLIFLGTAFLMISIGVYILIEALVRLSENFDTIAEAASKFGAAIANLVGGIAKTIFENLPLIFAAGVAIVGALALGIGAGPLLLIAAVGLLVYFALKTLAEFFPEFPKWGLSFVQGIGNGIAAGIGWVAEQAFNLAKSAKDAFCNFLGINSPSTVMAAAGVDMNLGLAGGIESSSFLPIGSMNNMSLDMLSAYAGPMFGEGGIGFLSSQIPVEAASGIESATGTATDGVSNLVGSLKEKYLSDMYNEDGTWKGAASKIPEGMADGVTENSGQVTDAASMLKNILGDEFDTSDMSQYFDYGALVPTTEGSGIESNASDLLGSNDAVNQLLQEQGLDFANSDDVVNIGEAFDLSQITGMDNNAAEVSDKAEEVASDAADAAESTKGDWRNIGENLSHALARGIGDGKSDAINSAINVAVSAYNAAKSALAINSPSKLFIKLGQGIDEGFIVGMERMSGDVADTSTLVATGIVDAAKDPLDYLADLMSGDIIDDPTITPVLDLSEIQNGANRLYSMMSDVDRYSLNGNIALANDASLSINRDQRRRQESENQMMGTLIDAINGLSALIGNTGNVYNVNGVTYDDGSNVSSAVRSLIRAAKIEGRA